MDNKKVAGDAFYNESEKIYSKRSKLELLAYKFLGTIQDAEDAVQETYLRWYKLTSAEREQIISPIAWQRTTLTRICFDKLKSAKSKREVYIGEWLPEPASQIENLGSTTEQHESVDPADQLILAHSVSMALMIVLDKMTPAERVSFILHDVFQYSFEEISEIVGRTPQACRQLASSGRKRINQKKHFPSSQKEHAQVNAAFRIAWLTGNIQELVTILDERVNAITDGGGFVSASVTPLFGRNAVIDFFLSAFTRQNDLQIEEVFVNGEPGLVGKAAGRTISVISTCVRDGRICDIWVMRNPEKLTDWH
ncbi:RNA polymerase sigma factor SigJ [Xenorhabdus innexi]|uniref:Putative sigma factor n=1 Tax=Xenorhabdus innexi TaxID=290109 RepID=A0A1N6MV23_9GAMM|nr:RNA polymerase sigma factor SigJ [Xenorhabdus innexi]PHM30135.1 RNA polymerase factor sigma-70 [Xenorhabdus innexi]SIP72715.1 putative sigma factor [Xenorhabdus innexi]